jgi:hypothetical protein
MAVAKRRSRARNPQASRGRTRQRVTGGRARTQRTVGRANSQRRRRS